jgi:hypothetical protein
MNKLLLVSVAIIIIGILSNNPFSTVSYGPGIIAPDEPIQTNTHIKPFFYHDIKIKPQASFKIEAKVLAKENYSSDPESIISPVDLALGWGKMSDEAILQAIDISQSHRFYYWHVDQFPIPRKEIEQSSANMHIIPANEDIAEQIAKIKTGELIRLSGYLVNLERSNGWYWNSSLTRNDTGAGACEVIWVETLEIVHKSEVEYDKTQIKDQ